jgi:hypothetical protein
VLARIASFCCIAMDEHERRQLRGHEETKKKGRFTRASRRVSYPLKSGCLTHAPAIAAHDLHPPFVAVGFIALDEPVVRIPMHALRFFGEVVARIRIVRV